MFDCCMHCKCFYITVASCMYDLMPILTLVTTHVLYSHVYVDLVKISARCFLLGGITVSAFISFVSVLV